MGEHVELRHGIYRDSVVLMQVSQAVASCGGVTAAIVAMATPLNIEVYERLGFDLAEVARATPNDLLVAIKGEVVGSALQGAAAELERQLAPPVCAARASGRHRHRGPSPRRFAAALTGTDLRPGPERLRRGHGRHTGRGLGDAVLRQHLGRPGDSTQGRGGASRRSRHDLTVVARLVGGLGLGSLTPCDRTRPASSPPPERGHRRSPAFSMPTTSTSPQCSA